MMDWREVEEQTPIPGFHGKVLHSDSMSFVLWRIDGGALLPEHSHVHEQVVHMLDGTFEVTVDGRTETLGPGMVSAIPSNALHSGRALTDCRILDAFSPVREDYRNGLTSRVISGEAKG
jgi:quercetin dioxygenase-like cupin family protein